MKAGFLPKQFHYSMTALAVTSRPARVPAQGGHEHVATTRPIFEDHAEDSSGGERPPCSGSGVPANVHQACRLY
jgi:hypothetical protein